MSHENLEYYSKFLTSSNRSNVPKNNNINFNISSPTYNESITASVQQPEISNMTYNLFIKQNGDSLSQNYFKNKIEEKNEEKNKKNNKFNKKNIYAFKNNNSERLKENNEKKKELLEEIIQANSKSIRSNNNFIDEKDNEFNNEEGKENLEFNELKKFNSDDLISNNVVEINLENEIENKRIDLEKKHKEIINNNLPDIYESINKLINDNNFYFVKNKYEDILKEYS
jgi:hypothetical protein